MLLSLFFLFSPVGEKRERTKGEKTPLGDATPAGVETGAGSSCLAVLGERTYRKNPYVSLVRDQDLGLGHLHSKGRL